MNSATRPSPSVRRSAFLATLLAAAVPSATPAQEPDAAPAGKEETVGRKPGGRTITPTNQVLTPAGRQVDLPGMRPQGLALSPDGAILVTAGKTHELVIIDPDSGEVVQRVPLPSETAAAPPADAVSPNILEPDTSGQLSFTGLVFSPDGSRIYLSNVNGSIKVFDVAEGHEVRGRFSIPLPPANAPRRAAAVPSGLALNADGSRLYVALNLANRLAEIDTKDGTVLRQWDVGFAPYDVRLAGGRAWVTNWGGRRPGEGDLTGPAGRGTLVRVDPVRHIASEGSVSIVDLEDDRPVREILTGLHASAIEVSPDGRHVVVANAGSDTLSVLDASDGDLVETIWTKLTPAELFGASPNALAFDADGETLFVCNGTQNAVAVIEFEPGRSELEGLIPVGWFPGAVVHDAPRGAVHVANIKGIGPGRPRGGSGAPEFNSHQYHGSVSIVPVPDAGALAAMTRRAVRNYRAPALVEASRPARPDQPAVPVPARTGEPSVFRHVVYIIKENRTYDQVLGDIPEGNGDPGLCIFGEEVTPNQHKLAREFVLLDNTYCSGILSADGHQWADSGFATDYMEKSFAGFPRSYPDGMLDEDVDALAYAPSGFIWDQARKHDKTVRSYGEFAITDKRWRDPERKGPLDFRAHWNDFLAGNREIVISSRPAIESLRGHLCTETVGWDMDIPDVFRAAKFIGELERFQETGGFPALVIICLPNDHTSGTRAGSPTPAAQVADNDLAMGRIVEAISRSRFWKETCIFAIEDDPQAGWDHVSGYRTTAYVASPYTKRGAVVSTRYNQTSILRTIGLMLGLPPMSQMDASATAMTDCFQGEPDFAPFEAVPNRVPLDQMNPEPGKVSDALLRDHAVASAELPLDEIDRCPEDLLNRILWHAMRGSDAPFPEWAVTADADDDDDERLQ